MNKIIFVSALLVALCGSIKAVDLDVDEVNRHAACIKQYSDDFDAVVIPERIEQIAEIVRGYEPGNDNLADIINTHDIDTSVFAKNSDDAEALKEMALKLGTDLLHVLTENPCITEDNFQFYLNDILIDPAYDNHARAKKYNDYIELCGEIRHMGDEFEDAEEEFGEDEA